jgi:hypothetical protein
MEPLTPGHAAQEVPHYNTCAGLHGPNDCDCGVLATLRRVAARRDALMTRPRRFYAAGGMDPDPNGNWMLVRDCDAARVAAPSDGLDAERLALVIEMENEGVVTWGDEGHRARFLASTEGERPLPPTHVLHAERLATTRPNAPKESGRMGRRWTYHNGMADAERSKLTTAERWSGKHGRCAMVSPTGKRCVLPFLHLGGHRTDPGESR